jgi:hypothetical protein
MKRTILIWIFVLLFFGCKKEKEHYFRIINKSPYDFKKLEYYGVISGEEISLHALDTSKIIILSYEKRFRLTPKLLGLRLDLNDSILNQFDYFYGNPTIRFDDSDLNSNVNLLILNYKVKTDSLIFNLKLN